jgi:uncharacterized membrane protein YagU involved in acid resistance
MAFLLKKWLINAYRLTEITFMGFLLHVWFSIHLKIEGMFDLVIVNIRKMFLPSSAVIGIVIPLFLHS